MDWVINYGDGGGISGIGLGSDVRWCVLDSEC